MVHTCGQLIQLLLMLVLCGLSSSQCPTTVCTCGLTDKGLKQINCRDKQLTQIPVFKQTSEVYDEITFASSQSTGCSSCNKIQTVQANAFANLQVKKIILTQNAVSSYDNNAFAGLETILEGLELEGDGTNSPPYDATAGLNQLTLLHFEHFSQTTIKKDNSLGAFSKLNELRFINMENLNNIVTGAFLDYTNQPKFPVLNTFILRDIPTITTLPAGAIQDLKNLVHLEISGTGITHIYGLSFQTLTKLINLEIKHNSQLQTIEQGAFTDLYKKLEFLHLGFNGLQSLSLLTAGAWHQLSQLNVQYNPLRTISASDFSAVGQNLTYLNLDSCELTSLSSDVFRELGNLHTLILSNNKIQTLGSDIFQNTPGLEEIKLDKQQTAMTLNANSFLGTDTSLKRLYIGKNSINTQVFWALIEKLPNLELLDAKELNLINVPDKAFKNNDKLYYLDLETNNISTLQEASFYRLRDSLQTLSLSYNSISTISKCVFKDFATLTQLHLEGNPLACNCGILWLYDKVYASPDIFQASFLIGMCHSPQSVKGKYLHEISRTDLCDGNNIEPTCTDLYATTTVTTTTTTVTTTTTTTKRPLIIPTITINFGPKTQTSINIIWTVSDKTDVTGYVLDILKGSVQYRSGILIHRDSDSDTIRELEPDTTYTFCLSFKLNNVHYPGHQTCDFDKTLPPAGPSTTTAVPSQPDSNIGIIVGAVVGGVAFIAIVILIVVLLLRFKKPPKKMPAAAAPVSFIPAPSGTLPQAGGTARRFAKPKEEKDGAASVDDIQITTISNGGLDGKDRFSAGSYQFLHEKDFHRPGSGAGPSTSTSHYVNDLSVERPLPKTPYGAPGSSRTKSKGYVNTAFTGSANPLPETSTNTYSELDASKIDKK